MLWNSRANTPSRFVFLLVLLAGNTPAAHACPFCQPQGPTFAQRREQADVVVLAEFREQKAGLDVYILRQAFQGQEQLHGASPGESLIAVTPTAGSERAARSGQLALLLGEFSPANAREPMWSVIPVNELQAAYYLRAPSLREPAATRLRYFAKFLEHTDRPIADDAYLEFAHAPFDVVRQVAPQVPGSSLRRWLESEDVLDQRKGLYALMLGLSPDSPNALTNAEYLRQRVEAQAGESQQGSDFRAGFDGVVGGYLAATGTAGLDVIDDRFLDNPAAAEGDLRHIVTALRFAHEFLPEIPPRRVGESMLRLLDRRGFTAAVIVDLARWRDTGALGRIAEQYQPAADAAVRRAVIGYLVSLQTPEADQHLEQLRAHDPEGVASAERYFEQYGGLGTAGIR